MRRFLNEKVLAAFKAEAVAPAFAEGDFVRSTNDLYKEYGVGRIQKARGAQAKVEFNPSVFMPPPYRSENKILHLAEIERVDTPLNRAARDQWDEPWRVRVEDAGGSVSDGQQGRPAFQRPHGDSAAPNFCGVPGRFRMPGGVSSWRMKSAWARLLRRE